MNLTRIIFIIMLIVVITFYLVYDFIINIYIIAGSITTGRSMKIWLITAAKFTPLIQGLLNITYIQITLHSVETKSMEEPKF